MFARELFDGVVQRHGRRDQIGRPDVAEASVLDGFVNRGGAGHGHDVAAHAQFELRFEGEHVVRHDIAGHFIELGDVHGGDLLGCARVVVHDPPALKDGLGTGKRDRAELFGEPQLVDPCADQPVRLLLVQGQREGFGARERRGGTAQLDPYRANRARTHVHRDNLVLFGHIKKRL